MQSTTQYYACLLQLYAGHGYGAVVACLHEALPIVISTTEIVSGQHDHTSSGNLQR